MNNENEEAKIIRRQELWRMDFEHALTSIIVDASDIKDVKYEIHKKNNIEEGYIRIHPFWNEDVSEKASGNLYDLERRTVKNYILLANEIDYVDHELTLEKNLENHKYAFKFKQPDIKERDSFIIGYQLPLLEGIHTGGLNRQFYTMRWENE